jgi:hypothetical protein
MMVNARLKHGKVLGMLDVIEDATGFKVRRRCTRTSMRFEIRLAAEK